LAAFLDDLDRYVWFVVCDLTDGRISKAITRHRLFNRANGMLYLLGKGKAAP